MIYGDIRSSFSPKGREYVTRWNPQSVPVVSGGSPVSGLGGSDSPLASALMGSPISQTTGGRDDSKDNSGEFSATASDSTKGSTTGAIGSPNAASFLGGGFPGMGYGYGGKLGAIGSVAGLVSGAPLGLVGNAVGTAFDVRNANNALTTTKENNPHLSAPSLGMKAYGSGFLNNATFGLLGQSVGDSMIESAITDVQTPGVPGYAPDPDEFAAAQGGGGNVGGYTDGGYASPTDAGNMPSDGNFFNKGGHVTRDRLAGPNPPGPDDGYAALDAGEFVIKASDVKKLGGPDKTRKRLAELLASK